MVPRLATISGRLKTASVKRFGVDVIDLFYQEIDPEAMRRSQATAVNGVRPRKEAPWNPSSR
jgi:hypothetical protein